MLDMTLALDFHSKTAPFHFSLSLVTLSPNVTGNPDLVAFLRARIEANGPVPFPWFMEQALYHPEHGYYASGAGGPGRMGDYFTSVSAGAVFGKLLAIQFREMWERMGKPGKFTIVEQGANNGDFAHDVLSVARADAPEFFTAVRYVIVEQFAILQKRQEEKLAGFAVEWRASLDALENFEGVHFSNELLDAMPVHLVRFTGGKWMERYVDWREGAFVWSDVEIAPGKLREWVSNFSTEYPEGYTTEVNLEAREWMAALSTKLSRGHVLIADYGYPREIFYSPERTTGTLACYSQHRRGDDPLVGVGLADITAHVDFTSVAEAATVRGLRVVGFTDQHHFMVGLGKEAFPDATEKPDATRQKELRIFSTLMHPSIMGMNFKFLGLEKSVPSPAPLAGFQFSGDGLSALGLA